MSQQVCRWGILSTAGIGRKNWQAIHFAENATVTAVASRDTAKAAAFIEECQREAGFCDAPKAYGDYESLLADVNVDAVYVPLPTGLRKDWVVRAAEAGKHVLCEKPCAVSLQDLQEMTDACKKNNVQFMDGVMYMHSARLPKLREAIDSASDDGNSIGKLKRIASHFSFLAPEEFFSGNIRASAETEPAGCAGDLGWYTIRFSLFVNNFKMPHSVRGCILQSLGADGLSNDSDGIPMEFSGELFWDEGVSASFYCSFLTENQEWANISGTKGNIMLTDFVLPFSGNERSFDIYNPVLTIEGGNWDMQPNRKNVTVTEGASNTDDAQEANMIRNFSAQVLAGKLNKDWPAIALKTQQIMDACIESARNGSSLVKLS